MNKIKLMNLKPEKFTLDPSQGWIYMKNVKDLRNGGDDIQEENEKEPTVFIVLTGWKDKYNKNVPFWFNAPYSSHSNFRELERFVKAICPRNLVFNVDDRAVT